MLRNQHQQHEHMSISFHENENCVVILFLCYKYVLSLSVRKYKYNNNKMSYTSREIYSCTYIHKLKHAFLLEITKIYIEYDVPYIEYWKTVKVLFRRIQFKHSQKAIEHKLIL